MNRTECLLCSVCWRLNFISEIRTGQE